MGRALALSAALAALGVAEGDGGPRGPDAGEAPDACEPSLDGSLAHRADEAPPERCAALQARVDRRKEWLRARREEQFVRGPPNPKRGIPDVVHLFCEAQPAHEECILGNAVLEASPDELLWTPDAGIDDFEPHVILMERALRECQGR